MQKRIHMDYTAGTSWIQQQHVPGTLDGRSPTNGDWKEAAVSPSGAGPSGVQSSMDLGDFGMDLSGEHSARNNGFPDLYDNVAFSTVVDAHVATADTNLILHLSA